MCWRILGQKRSHFTVAVILSKCQFFLQQLKIDDHKQTSIRGKTEGQSPAARLWISAKPITVGTQQTSRQDSIVPTTFMEIDWLYMVLFGHSLTLSNTYLQQTDLQTDYIYRYMCVCVLPYPEVQSSSRVYFICEAVAGQSSTSCLPSALSVPLHCRGFWQLFCLYWLQIWMSDPTHLARVQKEK